MVSSKSRKSNVITLSRYWDSVVTLHFCLSYSLYKGHGSTPFDSYSHNCYQASLKKKNLCFGKCLSEKWRLQLRCLRGLCHEYFKKDINRILGLKAYYTCAKYALNCGIIDLWHLIWGWWEYLPQLSFEPTIINHQVSTTDVIDHDSWFHSLSFLPRLVHQGWCEPK